MKTNNLILQLDDELSLNAEKIATDFCFLRNQLVEVMNAYGIDIADNEYDVYEKVMKKMKSMHEDRLSSIKNQIPSVINRLISQMNGENVDSIYQTIQTIKQLDADGKYEELCELIDSLEVKPEKKIKEKPTSTPRIHKNPQTILKVTYPNGDIIQFPKAADTIVEVVRRAGFANVERLGLRSSGAFLVSRETTEGRNVRQCENGWFVSIHSNTMAKKREIEIISKELSLGLKVEIVS